MGSSSSLESREDEAIAALRQALRQRPDAAPLHHQLGLLLASRGELEAAAHSLRAALRLRGDFADAAFHLGNVLWRLQRNAEAIAAYRRALAVQPGFGAAHNNLALVLQAEGRWEDALAALRAAHAVDDTPEIGINLARCLLAMPRVPADASTRALVARALAQAWTRPADLARVAAGLLRMHPVIGAAIEQAGDGRAAPLSADVRQACEQEPLFAAFLENAHASDRALELFLAGARRALLEAWQAGRRDTLEASLAFLCALARQCFLDDYVFSLGPGEREGAEALERALGDALREGAMPAEGELALLACYVPLAQLGRADALLEHAWPRALQAVVAQQVAEPMREAQWRERIPALTPIESEVSRRVRRQYEENPYPRWTRLPASGPFPLDAYLRGLFPHAHLGSGRIADADILIAGCGTGQESLDLARQHPSSRILALDLSRASLAYAARKTAEAGCGNVEYAQADITQLHLGREFDLVSCVGVLHHLDDPLTGWRALARHLRPGGFMQVGLYSAAARRDITAARAMIAARGYAPVPDDIRRCREEIFSGSWPAISTLRDLYGMNECRDLLFHVQEHCTTLAELRETLDAVGLRFVGMAVGNDVAHAFAARFPDPAAAGDLAAWDAFEREHPDTFAGMYVFWAQRPAHA